MKMKGLKTKKRKMDLDAFIEDEMNNLQKKGQGNPLTMMNQEPKVKKKKKDPGFMKPSFIAKKKKGKQQEQIPFEEPPEVTPK